jgi:hypothetical protein
MKKTPIAAGTVTGVESNTAEAAMDPATPVSGISAVDLKEIHSDLSQLPERVPEIWEAR